MPTSTLTPDDHKLDNELNPGQRDHERRVKDLSGAEKRGTIDMSEFEQDYNGNTDNPQDENIQNTRNKEASSTPSESWDNLFTPDGSDKKSPMRIDRKQMLKLFFKKAGPTVGIGGGIGGILFILSIILGPASLPISLMQNLMGFNDTSTTAMHRYFLKTLDYMNSGDDTPCTGSKIKCNSMRMSNAALRLFNNKGITAVFEDGSTYTNKRTGYPDKKIKSYQIDLGDNKTETIAKQDLSTYLEDNPKIGAKILGTGGAYNPRLKSWSGKYISQKFFKPAGIHADGGLANGAEEPEIDDADGDENDDPDRNKQESAFEELHEKIPETDLDGVVDGVKSKVDSHLNKAKRGGVGYLTAAGTCIGIKGYFYTTSAVVAANLPSILPIVNEAVLSPGAKTKASGIDPANSISAEASDKIGTMFTNKTPREEDGKLTAAVDSKYLLAAAGVNKGKPPVSKYTPGYSFFTHPIVVQAAKVDKATESACNAIMSPAAMYSAMAVDAAVTVVASGTVIGGIGKVIVSAALSEAIAQITNRIAGNVAKTVLAEIANSNALREARGEAFGDVVGVSATTFFAAGGMARHLPTLKVSEIDESVAKQQETESFQREMDIASLSPFDTSSKYTFLGNIVSQLNTTALATGAYNNGFFGTFTNVLQTAASTMTDSTYAATSSKHNYCGYGDDYRFYTPNPADMPATTSTGMPCTDLLTDMLPYDAFTVVENEEWLDETKDVADDASVSDLQANGYFKDDTPLTDRMDSCGDALPGDYIFNGASCTLNRESKSTQEITNQTGNCFQSDDGSQVCDENAGGAGIKDPRALEAIPAMLYYHQITKVINVEDDEGAGTTTPPTMVNGIDEANLFKDSTTVACAAGTTEMRDDTGYNEGTAIPVKLCSLPNTTENGKPALVNSRASGAVVAMFDQMKKDLSLDSIAINDSFRTMAEQQALRASLGSQAAPPGYSNHQMGYAFDVNMGMVNYKKDVNTSYPGNRIWEWLKTNAGKYHFSQYAAEGWHWSVNGK
jgi:hypothetical protein